MDKTPSTTKPRRTRKTTAGTPNLRCIPPISGASHDLELSAQEAQLVRDFRVLSEEVKSIYYDAMHDCAMEVRNRRPALCIVKGGAA